MKLAPTLGGRVSRREIALVPVVWWAVSGALVLFAVACVVIAALLPVDHPRELVAFGVALGVTSLALGRRAPPEPDAPLTHLVIAITYVGTSCAMVLLAPFSLAGLPVAIFVGMLSAVWLGTRREIALHYAAATVIVLAPGILGVTDTATLVAALTLLPSAWALGGISLWVLESAERQSERLEAIAMRDPLTGVGNRRLLEDRLDAEVARHHASRRPLSVLALDLDGFKAINDAYGHAAGDQLLVRVARTLTEVVGARATVARQGGDEFCVIVPETGPRAAAQLAEQITAALATVIGTGVGIATYPADTSRAAQLLELADHRLTAHKSERRHRLRQRTLAPNAGGWEPEHDEAAANARATAAHTIATRETLGASIPVWRVTGAMFLFYVFVGVLMLWLTPELCGTGFELMVAAGAVIGVVVVAAPPPAVSTFSSHLVLALTYVAPTVLMATSTPRPSLAIGAAVFVGPVVAVRTTRRIDAAAHLGVASALFLAVAVSGIVEPGSALALVVLTATMLVLALGSVVVLEAAEAQGAELARLGAVDPLTGLANRRQLADALQRALEGPATSVGVIALDLNGFKALNDALGHGAGDALLVDVARALRGVVGAGATIARPGGDEFTVVLAGRAYDETVAIAGELRAAVARLSRPGYPISTGVGVACAPDDTRDVEALQRIADERLLVDKYGTFLPGCAPARA